MSNSSVPTSASPSAPPLARLLFGLLLAWAAVALVYEAVAARHDWDRRRDNVPPCVWRFGMAPVERLRTCLAGTKGRLPRDTVVLFSSLSVGPCDPDFYRWRWAAYLLPDLLVARANDAEALRQASYLITYRRLPEPLPGCRLDLVRQLDGGRLYRIHHP